MASADRLAMLRLFQHATLYVFEAENPKIAAAHVAVAVGVGWSIGNSMEDIARQLGVTRQCISKGARDFGRSLNLPPSPYQKAYEPANCRD